MSDYRFDPEFDALRPALPTVTDFSSLEVIQGMRDDRAALFGQPEDRDDVTKEDRKVPGRDGDPEVTLRIYRPKITTAEPRPCVYEIHGGGFMMGNIEMMDGWCQKAAAELEAVVVSVEYRLAPETPFPGGLEDCYAGLAWTHENAESLGVDATRIAIAGQSAGGGLAAGLALLARDRGGPPICFELLEIPEIDDRLETASMKAFTDTPLWNRPNAVWSWKHYLGPDHSGDVSPYAAPARAKDLTNLPPAYVSTMEFDPLRDEGIEYALRLLQSGVSVELHSYPGTFHGSSLMPGAEVSRRGAAEVMNALARALR
jgi:acetyl esterase/lipase